MSEQSIAASVSLSHAAKQQLSLQKRAHRINNEKYFRVHPELRQMCSAFISALLADKPDDVHLYAEQFFTNPELAHSLGLVGWSRPETPQEEAPMMMVEDEFDEDELNPEIAGTTDMDTVDLEQLLISLFKEADADGSGTLDHNEFANLMATADLGLSTREVKALLAEADADQSGTISYEEFVPLAVETVQLMRIKQRSDEFEAEASEEYMYVAGEIIGQSADEFSGFVRQAGEKLGAGGMFSKSQLKAFLKSPSLGLSKAQANAAVAEVGFDAEGMVAVATLEAGLYQIVIKVIADALAMQNLGEVGEELAGLFGHYDKEDSGLLDKKVVRTALLQGYPFLTKLQVAGVLNDAPTSDEGLLRWKEFLPKLTSLVKAMGDPAAIRERAEMSLRAEFQPIEFMSHLDREKFEQQTAALFAEADKDGNGVLDVHEFQRVLGEGSLGLSRGEIDMLRDIFDTDGDALISLDEFQSLAYNQLAQIARERAIMDAMEMSY